MYELLTKSEIPSPFSLFDRFGRDYYCFEIKSRTTHSFTLRFSTASNHSLHLKTHIPGEYTVDLLNTKGLDVNKRADLSSARGS